MPFELTVAQVQALAPDASSAAAGKKLSRPASWKNLGQSERAVWGECQGSALYQTRVALDDLSSKCSCPSRKFPCKHALGLLFLSADTPAAPSQAEEPEWVESWLSRRNQATEKKQARAELAASKPLDEQAQQRRSEKRRGNILEGLEQLDAWLNDLLRQGLSRLPAESPSFWEGQARRLVDAQAPALAGRMRMMGQQVGASRDWPARLLGELGSVALLTHAYRRQDQLLPALAADVRRFLGLNLEQADVIAHGDLVEDDWTVLCEIVEDEERVRSQRVWLRGAESERVALILQFAVAGGRFAEALPVGTRVRARLAFWPSACPQRALVVERLGQAHNAAPPTGADVTGCLAQFAAMLAQVPWLDRALFVLREVIPVPRPGNHGGWSVSDSQQLTLPLRENAHPQLAPLLLALSGGAPLTLLGEWDGFALSPVLAWSDGRMCSLLARRA